MKTDKVSFKIFDYMTDLYSNLRVFNISSLDSSSNISLKVSWKFIDVLGEIR